MNHSGIEFAGAGRYFTVGDKVMQVANDYTKEVFDGDIGWVPSFDRLSARQG